MTVAEKGGNVAKSARVALEKELGHSVVTSLNAKTYINQLNDKSDDQNILEDDNQ